MSFRPRWSRFYLFLCLVLAVSLAFCGDDSSNSTENKDKAEADPSAGTPSAPPPTNTSPDTETEPEHRFSPEVITAGLPFSFELVWRGKPYLLSLHNCGADTLLLQGRWPDSDSATTHIEGQDTTQLTDLAVVNTSGSPSISPDCQLKATVDPGQASEESTLVALNVKAGTIALSNVKMLEKRVTLDAANVPSTGYDAVIVGKQATATTADGVTYVKYEFVALSQPLSNAVENNKVADRVTLYRPEITLPMQEISAFTRGDYLVSVVSYRAKGTSIADVEFLHTSTIKASKD